MDGVRGSVISVHPHAKRIISETSGDVLSGGDVPNAVRLNKEARSGRPERLFFVWLGISQEHNAPAHIGIYPHDRGI